MALINCPECNKEISDKAAACPHCGNPMSNVVIPKSDSPAHEVDDKEYIFCPKCLSTHIHSEQKGFSGGKALVGALTVGPLGLLAGTIGSKKVNMTCLKCGNRFKAGEAFQSSHKEVQDIVGNFESRMIEDGQDIAMDYLKRRMKWQHVQAKDFVNFYLKGHDVFRQKYEQTRKIKEQERKRSEQERKKKELEKSAPKTIKGAIMQNVLALLLIFSIAFGLLYGIWYIFSLFSDDNDVMGIGFYVTFVIIALFLVFIFSLALKDDIARIKDNKKLK